MPMNNIVYWVKLERGLFRKPEWSITLNGQKIGLHNDRDEAVAVTVAEGERTSILGRGCEIWIDEGHGFTLYKAIKATKQKDLPEEGDDEDGPVDDLDVDESAYV